MKRFTLGTLVLTAALLGCVATGVQVGGPPPVAGNPTIGGFYGELSPYGQWVDCSYGQCWVPGQVAADWQPYSNGEWIYTEYGWTWVSSDPWGSSPYHYGTWASIPNYGWSWVPGTVWAPAWVTWSYSNNYVGWAPLPPTVVLGASGYAGSPVIVSQTQYVFVPTNRFVGANVAAARVPVQQSAQIFAETTPATRFAVSGGIVRNTALPMQTIERASGGKVETRSIQTAGTAARAVSPGNPHLAVVAPAGEVRAARPQAVSRVPSREPARAPAPVERESAGANVSKPAETRPVESHESPVQTLPTRGPAVARPPEATRPLEPASRPAPEPGREQPAERPARPPAPTPAARDHAPRQPEAGRPPEHAPKPTPRPAKDDPEDKKPDGSKA